MTPILTKNKLAEHLALPSEFSAPCRVCVDDLGRGYVVFDTGFDLIEFDAKFPGLFSSCPVLTTEIFDDTFFIGSLH